MTEEEKKAIEVLEKYKFSEREEYLENNAKKIVITVADKLNAEEQGNEKDIKAYSNALDVYNAKADLIEHILAEVKHG